MTRPQLRVVRTPDEESRRDQVMAALAGVVPKYRRLCNRRGGCRNTARALYRPVIDAYRAEVPARLRVVAGDDPRRDRVMAALAVFVRKYDAHEAANWTEAGRASMACAAFMPVADAYDEVTA